MILFGLLMTGFCCGVDRKERTGKAIGVCLVPAIVAATALLLAFTFTSLRLDWLLVAMLFFLALSFVGIMLLGAVLVVLDARTWVRRSALVAQDRGPERTDSLDPSP
jgi:hypothetical protein